MHIKVKAYLPALLCALLPVLCYVVIRPFAEMGIDDDWSYIKTAQVLAQTGHIVYNGWGSPILGWNLYVALLFIKLFGFSFTAVRLSSLVEAIATAFLLQRTMVRAGLHERNATLATIAFILSPLYIPLAMTYMTDVPGFLVILLCLYMCLRALEARSESARMAWICGAALVNALGGTVRQTAWLGVLVMVPSTLALLRRERRVLAAGGLSCIAGAGFALAAMHWYARQPFSNALSLNAGTLDLSALHSLGGLAFEGIGELALLLLPVLLMFAGAVRKGNRRMGTLFVGGWLCFLLLAAILSARGKLNFILAPYNVSYILSNAFSVLNLSPFTGSHLGLPRDTLRLLLTGVTVAGLLVFVAFFAGRKQGPVLEQHERASISWQTLGIVLGPFTCAYIAWLCSLSIQGIFMDRYLLPLLAFCLLALTLYYQQNVKARLPLACIVVIAILGGFGIAGTHDEFALYRGFVISIVEMRSRGVHADTILEPWEFAAWTEAQKTGFVASPFSKGTNIPEYARVPSVSPRTFPSNCGADLPVDLIYLPAIKPVYATSFNPTDCDGPAGFPVVTYSRWLTPRVVPIYVVKLPPM